MKKDEMPDWWKPGLCTVFNYEFAYYISTHGERINKIPSELWSSVSRTINHDVRFIGTKALQEKSLENSLYLAAHGDNNE